MSDATLLVAVPGKHRREPTMPPGATAEAVAAIEALSERLEADRLFGFLRPRLRATWCPSPWNVLTLLVDDREGELLARSSAIAIEWRWCRLWESDDWYEVGWHPDEHILALMQPWQDRIWNALNPGKRPTRRRR